MKIIREDKVYIQKGDIGYLNMSDVDIPAPVYYNLFESGTMIVGEFNRLEFEEYNSKELVDFFKKLTWILDYDEVKDLTDREIELLGEELIDQRNSIATMYNNMSEEDRKKHQSLRTQCELIEYKLGSLKEFLMYKKGNIKMQLPGGVNPNSKNKKGIKQFVKSIYDKFKK